MAASTLLATILVTMFLFLNLSGLYATTFTMINKCSYTVWPGILSGAGTTPLSPTGFALKPGQSNAVAMPPAWSGIIWGRTLCSEGFTGKFSCITGDCGSPAVECNGGNPTPPVTLAEFTLNDDGGLDFFRVSFVDGYNIPITVEPWGGAGAGNCAAAGCVVELNAACPRELKVISKGEVVACKSACVAFGDPHYCCIGAYATPDTCKPNRYSLFFKSVCPLTYSYAYDDVTNIFTCASADFHVIFCPSHPTSSMEPVKGKEDPKKNAEGQSFTNIIVVTVVGAVVTSVCGLLAYNLRFYLRRMCGIHVPEEV